jgi:transcriptional regulator with XRE-family HTH domain
MTEPTGRVSAREVLRVNIIFGRAQRRLSQDELARLARVSRPTISRIERAAGDVGVDVVQRIADALGTTVSKLFSETRTESSTDAELARRLADPPSEWADFGAVLDAIDEADAEPHRRAAPAIKRYSRAGRPPLAS